MAKTYRAILTGDRLQWQGDAPPANGPRRVSVVVEEEGAAAGEPNGAKLADILEELAKLDPFSEIDDPVAWQREIRRDRPLPGRNLPSDD